MPMPSITPKPTTPAMNARTEFTIPARRNRHILRNSLKSHRFQAAAIKMPPKAALGREYNRLVRQSMTKATVQAATTDVIWLRLPVDSAAAVREPLPEIGRLWVRPAEMFPIPRASIS